MKLKTHWIKITMKYFSKTGREVLSFSDPEISSVLAQLLTPGLLMITLV